MNATSALDGTASSRERWLTLPVPLLGLLSLWDMYASGVRPFDLLAVGLAILLAGIQFDRMVVTRWLGALLLLALFVLAEGIRGVLADGEAVKPLIGMMLGLALAILVSISRWDAESIVDGLKLLILIHAAALIVQMALFYGTGRILNYHGWLGITPRLESLFFRPAGLFQEPAHFSLMMFGLVSLYRLLGGRSLLAQAAALLSILLSVSFWGVAAVFLYLVLFAPGLAALVTAAVGVVGMVGLSIARSDDVIVIWAVRRLENIGSDGSAQSRYSGLLSGNVDPNIFWFGQGVNNDYLATGSSSISFLINVAGLTGLMLFATFWVILAPAGRRLRGGVCLAIMLTAATQWTAGWWWVWISLAAVVPRIGSKT